MQKKLESLLTENRNIEIFTKIQEAFPTHLSTLPHKEVGFYVHVEFEKTIKINNCVESEHKNAEIYKRFSKNFIKNVNNQRDQIVLCCGVEEESRMQTSIGIKKNPGLFMIAGISILDEKYQNDHTKFDIEIAFLEYREGKLYDLLTNTGQALKVMKTEEKTYFNCGQTYSKVNTFNHFLKLFKIALFNNKQRDFKTLNNDPDSRQINSTFIMTIVSKFYKNGDFSGQSKVQRTTLIDLAENCSLSLQSNQEGKKYGQEQGNGFLKGIWEYLLIQLNNMTGRKKMHYHLVEPNPLLNILKYSLKYCKNYFIASLSADSQKFQQNYRWIKSLMDLIDSVPSFTVENSVKKSNLAQQKLFLSSFMIPVQDLQCLKSEIGKLYQVNNYLKLTTKENRSNFKKQIDKQLSTDQQIILVILFLKKQISAVNYHSLREYRVLKEKCSQFLHYLIKELSKFKGILVKELEIKKKLIFNFNLLISDELQLIGNCVKSQHYKDFYSAKSYLSLEREVKIKTDPIKQILLQISQERAELHKKYSENKKQNIQFFNKLIRNEKKTISNKSLPMTILNLKFMQKMRCLSMKVMQYLSFLHYRTIFENQRTLADEVIRGQMAFKSIQLIIKQLIKFSHQLSDFENTQKFTYQQIEQIGDAHLNIFVNQIRQLIKQQKKRHPNHKLNIPTLLKRRNLNKILPSNHKEEEKQEVKSRTNALLQHKFSKLPIVEKQNNKQNIVIKGKFDIVDLLVDPTNY